MERVRAIASRRVIADGRLGPRVVVVEGDAIARLEGWDGRRALPPGGLDVGESVLMAGIVDTHVHINEPGRTDWEGFETGTAAAAAGGVTTIVAMPLNCTPAATTREALLAEARAAEGKCLVDYGLWGGVVPGNLAEIAPMLDAGALGMKCFLVPSGVDDFAAIGERELREAMRVLAARGAPLLVHAEDPTIIARSAGGLEREPRSNARYLASRPAKAETKAIQMMIGLCRDTRCRVHIVHLASGAAAALVRAAAREELPFTGETCPHYLTFAAEEIGDGATVFKCAPPIRERAERDALWDGLRDGSIDLVASDHSPCPPEMKRLKDGDFAAAWGGIASLELGLGALWTQAADRAFGPADMARWMCEGPARLAGLIGRKGRIAIGYDADLVIWNPESEFVVDAARLRQRHKITPYAGRTLCGVVDMTIVRGQTVYERGTLATDRRGRWIKWAAR